MSKAIATLVLALLAQITYSQSDSLQLFEDSIFNSGCIEFPPKYPGGHAAMERFFVANLRYPDGEEGINGKIIIQFAVDTFGNVINIKISKGICHELDQEAIRLIRLLKGWTPATLNGRKIVYYLTQPFTICAAND